MREMTERLATDPDLAAAYRRAHESYLAERDAIEPLGTQVTAGGMPDRVKCLHVHAAHALARRPGREPVRRRDAGRAGRLVGRRPLRPDAAPAVTRRSLPDSRPGIGTAPACRPGTRSAPKYARVGTNGPRM